MTEASGLSRLLCFLITAAVGVLPKTSIEAQAARPALTFVAGTAADTAAQEEYVEIWNEDGARIIDALERIAGLAFEEDSIAVIILVYCL